MGSRKLMCIAVTMALASPAHAQSAVTETASVSLLTKNILLKAIELNRYMLHFRAENDRQPKSRLVRYFGAQEAGAACVLAFEIIADKELGANQHTPLRVKQISLRHGFETALTGSAIAGGASAVELASNFMRGVQNRKAGYDSRTAANRFTAGIAHIDAMLKQRDALISQQPSEAQEYLRLETRVMNGLRSSLIREFVLFYEDTAGYRAFENTFFLLNAGTNAIAGTSAGIGIKSLKTPKLAGPSNILFTVAGALTTITPPATRMVSRLARNRARDEILARLGLSTLPSFDKAALDSDLAALQNASAAANPARNAISQRINIYTGAADKFDSTLRYETRRQALLRQVAVQTSYLGPPIGASLLTQGILGTRAYYKYQTPPFRLDKLRAADRLNYAGAISGTVGASAAVLGNAGLLAASLAYREHARKANTLPEQLIAERLKNLDAVQKTVESMPPANVP